MIHKEKTVVSWYSLDYTHSRYVTLVLLWYFSTWLFKHCYCSSQDASVKICEDTSQNASVSTHCFSTKQDNVWLCIMYFIINHWSSHRLHVSLRPKRFNNPLRFFWLKTTLVGPHVYPWPRWKAHTNMSLSAGRLSYDVNPQRKELSVSVSDMLEDYNYHLRLCRKDFICAGTGANKLVSPSQYDCVAKHWKSTDCNA